MKSRNSIDRRALPLQLVLIVPFILQIFGAVSLVGYLSFKNGQKAVNDLADQLMARTSNIVGQHLNSYISIAHKVLKINADTIEMGLLDVRDRQTAGRFFWKQMQVYDLSYIGIGLTTGEGAGASRYDGKTVTIDDWTAKPPKNWHIYRTDLKGNRLAVIESFDWNSLQEPWYTKPVKAGKPIWTQIVTMNYSYPYIAATAGRPIYDAKNRLLGMVSVDIHLLVLSDFLRSLEISRYGQVFIVERDGMLIANSSQQHPFTLVKDKVERLKAIDSPDPKIRGIATQIQQMFDGYQSIKEPKKLQLDWQKEHYYVWITPWRDRYGLDWLLVVSVPEKAFMGQIHSNTISTIWLCLGALAIASVMGIYTSGWVVRPILRLNQASQAIASGNLNQTVKSSRIEELNALSISFNYMAKQLLESFAALEKINTELEKRVEARTAELKNALIELQRTQAQVVQNEKMSSLGQLVAGVAHEINNPVNFIHANITYIDEYTQSLLRTLTLYQQRHPTDDPELQALLEEIDLEFLIEDLQKILCSMKTGTERIRNIVLSLRNFSRMDEAEFKGVDIHSGIESTLSILQHRLKATLDRPEIQVICNYGQLPKIECYPGQLNQVFMNILVNAIDALDELNATSPVRETQENQNQITISTSMNNSEWVEISIADNGIGIPESIQNRIFDPFFTTKPVGKGTGMGMAICYQIITEKHGGKIKVSSTPGKGSVLAIELPRCQKVRNK